MRQRTIKICPQCERVRPIADFAFRDKVKKYRSSRCPDCEREHGREMYRRRIGRDPRPYTRKEAK